MRSGSDESSTPTPKVEVYVLIAHEDRRSTMVRVREGHGESEFFGMRGTIQELWVSDAPAGAVEVLLENGSLRLFWLRDLVVVDEDIAV